MLFEKIKFQHKHAYAQVAQSQHHTTTTSLAKTIGLRPL